MGNTPESCRHLTVPGNETSFKSLYECWIERSTASRLQKYLPITILTVSLICNCLSFVALRSRHMRGTSTAFFMLALSVLDPLVLLTKNLVYYQTYITEHSTSCKILYFLIYVYGYTNVWILVIMTADKFFAVWFPLKVSYFCTITRAKYVCIFLLTVTSVISCHHFWTIDSLRVSPDVNQRHCSYDIQHYPIFSRNWRYADFIIWCFLPFILILTLSVLIIYKLGQKGEDLHRNIRKIINTNLDNEREKIRLNQSSSTPRKEDQANLEMRSTQKTDVIRSRHRHITLMLLAVAVVFLLLTLPNSIYFVLDNTYGFNTPPSTNDFSQWLRYQRLTLLTIIMYQLSDVQHAANFFLYLLTSNKFRQTISTICSSSGYLFISLFRCCCPEKIRSNQTFANHFSSQRKEKNKLFIRSSASDMSSITINPRRISARQNQSSGYSARKSKQLLPTPPRLTLETI